MTARVLLLAGLIGCSGESSSAPEVETIELGPVTSGTPVALEIGPHALGAHIVVELDDPAAMGEVGIEQIDSPTGQRVVDNFIVTGHAAPIGSTPYGIAAIALPQTAAAMPMVEGTWQVTFSVPPGQTAHARAYVRTTEDGQFHGGTLDIRIYIPDGLMIADPTAAHTISAADAATDPAVVARVDAFFETLASSFQLERGEVEFVALPAEHLMLGDDTARVAALRATTAFEDGFGVHFVWSNGLYASGTRLWGQSAWLPGVANEERRATSGVVVDVSHFPALGDGMTMVHELGHFLGLFHTTEGNRFYHDPLDDTPECTTDDRVCPDGANIMFATYWGASGGVGVNASDQQRSVVWASPVYRSSAQ